jgi:hypothetical protein
MARLDDQRGTADHLHAWDADMKCSVCGVSRLVIGNARLEGALMASESSEHVLTEALHSMQETRFLLADLRVFSQRIGEAVAVLEQGIADARYALNLSDPLEKL